MPAVLLVSILAATTSSSSVTVDTVRRPRTMCGVRRDESEVPSVELYTLDRDAPQWPTDR
jgi:hypothetical protein